MTIFEGMPRRIGGGGQSPYMTSQIKELAVDPCDPNVVYAGSQSWVTAGVYKSMDGGQHCTCTTRHGQQDEPNMVYGWLNFWGPAVECLAASPVRPGRIAFGTSGHVFTSDDGGETWQQRYCLELPDGRFSGNGLEVTCLNAVVPDPTKRERLWFCYADIGLLVSDDSGQSFRRSFQGMKNSGNCFTVVVDPEQPTTVWSATGQWTHNAGDICRSGDGGRTWQVVGTPETGLPDGQVRHLVLDCRSPLGQRRLLATVNGSGIYESRDGGRSWRPIHSDLSVGAVKEPRGLLLDPANPQHLVVVLGGVSETGAGIYATRDGGSSWKRLHEAGLFADITSLAFDLQEHRPLVRHHAGALRSGNSKKRIRADCSPAATPVGIGIGYWIFGSARPSRSARSIHACCTHGDTRLVAWQVVGYSGTAESATTSCTLNRQIRVTRRTPSEYWLRRLFPGFGRTPRLYGKHET